MKRTSLKKCFWKTLKPFLSDKVQFYEKIKVAEEDTPITSEKEVSMKLNDFSQMLLSANISFESFFVEITF